MDLDAGPANGCPRLFIEMNPVRAGMVEHPAEYRWSSYRVNAQAEQSALIKRHSLYQAFGEEDGTRAETYCELFRHQLDPGLVDQIRSATNGNYALGSSRFTAEVESVLGRRATRAKSGRPKQSHCGRRKLWSAPLLLFVLYYSYLRCLQFGFGSRRCAG